ncbi:hypothetical protein [Nitrosospira sp. Nsp1]|uniref:hypothetical protein n=1 Tax=Nitrosospira sp. Nsp1 TaxID=136547 RepID=UPI000B86A649|nr:hypothetical protein [Nitrosospira sp. Nsp1]
MQSPFTAEQLTAQIVSDISIRYQHRDDSISPIVLDQGVIYLIDDRFTRPEVLRLLPDWWKVERYKTKRQDKLASLTPTQEIKPLRDSAPSSLPIIYAYGHHGLVFT